MPGTTRVFPNAAAWHYWHNSAGWHDVRRVDNVRMDRAAVSPMTSGY